VIVRKWFESKKSWQGNSKVGVIRMARQSFYHAKIASSRRLPKISHTAVMGARGKSVPTFKGPPRIDVPVTPTREIPVAEKWGEESQASVHANMSVLNISPGGFDLPEVFGTFLWHTFPIGVTRRGWRARR